MKTTLLLNHVAALAVAAGIFSSAYSGAQTVTNCDPAPAGMVGWWKADGNALDSVGTNTGTLSGAGFVAGEVGLAFTFKSPASVNIPRAPELDVGNQVTVEFWMKADPTNAMQTYQGLVTSDFYGIEIADGRSLSQTMGLSFFISADSGAFFPQTADANGNGGGFAVSAGQWHHVAGTYDGTQLQLYVDGLPAGNPYLYSGPISPMLANSFISLGSEDGRQNCPTCLNVRYFDGLIDEATIYNRALSAAEIAAIYNAGSAGKCLVAGAPVILGQPSNFTTDAGGSAIFTVQASGNPVLAYQWFFGTSLLQGATNSELFLSGVQTNQAGSYSVIVSNALGSVVSSNATLTVMTFPPAITVQPVGTNVYVGSNVLFRVVATGAPLPGYQWQKGSTAIPGATASIYAIPHAQLTDSGAYSVIVTNTYGAVTSSVALLNVKLPPPCTPAPAGLISWWRAQTNTLDSYDNQNGVVPYPFTMRYTAGKVGTAFSVNQQAFVVVPDSPALRVTNAFSIEAWVNPQSLANPGTIVAKFDSAGFQLPRTEPTNSSFYLGITNSGILRLSVTPNGSPNSATTLKSPTPIPASQWSFVVATYDGASLQLYVNAVLVAQTNYSAGIFPGTADLGLGTIPAVNQAQLFGTLTWLGALDEISLYGRALTPDEIQAIYNADVSGKCLIPPTITLQPQSQAIPLGEDVLFAPTVLGAKPLAYQWHFNGVNLLGATNSTLLLEKVQSNRVGNYSVFITNSVGATLSSNATLTLLPPPVCTPPSSNLVSWWPADGFASDVIGTNNPTILIDITYPTGKVGRAFSFNGANSRFSIPNSPSLNFGSNADFSIEGWVKVVPLPQIIIEPPFQRPSYDNVPLFEKRSLSVGFAGDSGYSLSLYRGRLAFWLGPTMVIPPAGSAGSMFASSGPDLRDGMFHHVAVSLSRSITNGGNLYVDGQLVLNFNIPRIVLSNSAPLYIGASTISTTNSLFTGLLDELALYNRALSADEILAIRQAGAAGKCKVPPFIVRQPAHTNVPPGHAATFTVVAGGGATLRYQWRFGTKILQGATAYSLTISNVQPLNAGSYAVLVTNGFGSVLSSSALLTLNTPPIARCTNVTVAADSNCVAFASIDNGSSDSDGDAITLQQSPPAPYPLGTNFVTLTAIDNWGASNSCVAMVLVLDQTPPQLSCPADITVEFTNETGASVSFTPQATDNCSGPVSLVSVPPSGSTFPIGTSTVRCTATDAAGNSNSCTFQVTVLGAQGVKSNVLVQLSVLSGSVTRSNDLAHLTRAIDRLASSLQPGIWLDQTHVTRSQGELAFNEESATVQELQLLLADKHSSLSQTLLQDLIDRIVKADRLLAVVAIQDALVAGADPNNLVLARQELAQGDNAISQGQYPPGIDDYRNAWKQAEHLSIKLAVHVVNGRLSLDAVAFPSETYVIETSTNLLDWTVLGTTTADTDGSIHMDADAGLGAQFYRTQLLP
jgi:hypothetical protein